MTSVRFTNNRHIKAPRSFADGALSPSAMGTYEGGHSFRASLPISALAVTLEPEIATRTTVQDDIRMFVLSFVTFFMGISLFIW